MLVLKRFTHKSSYSKRIQKNSSFFILLKECRKIIRHLSKKGLSYPQSIGLYRYNNPLSFNLFKSLNIRTDLSYLNINQKLYQSKMALAPGHFFTLNHCVYSLWNPKTSYKANAPALPCLTCRCAHSAPAIFP